VVSFGIGLNIALKRSFHVSKMDGIIKESRIVQRD